MRILLIDDDEDFGRIFEKSVSGTGHFCTSATNYVKAMESIFSSRPDVILVDVYLPGKNGFQIIRDLKSYKYLSGVPMITLTGLDTEESEMLSGCTSDGYISKTLPIREIVAACQEKVESWKNSDQHSS